jgi:hypothetical protein
LTTVEKYFSRGDFDNRHEWQLSYQYKKGCGFIRLFVKKSVETPEFSELRKQMELIGIEVKGLDEKSINTL